MTFKAEWLQNNLSIICSTDSTLGPTCRRGCWVWAFLCLGWRADEGVADGAHRYAILLNLSTEAVKESLNCVLGGSIWETKARDNNDLLLLNVRHDAKRLNAIQPTTIRSKNYLFQREWFMLPTTVHFWLTFSQACIRCKYSSSYQITR